MTARGMWRYFDRLPVIDPANIVTLGEGGTPLLDLSDTLGAELGIAGLYLKAEDRNPTGSFKARIASVAASLVRERNLAGLVGTSSGNGGAAGAAYAAAAKSRIILFTLSDTIPVKMLEITAVGGAAYRVRGVGHDAASTRHVAEMIAAAGDAKGYYPMLTGFHYAPEAMMGVETIAFELAEEIEELSAVYAPVGGGGLLTGLHRGFLREWRADNRTVPRMVGVHPQGATALPLAIKGLSNGMDGPVTTSISGLQMAILFDTAGATTAIEQSGGHATAVSDADVSAAQRRLAHEFGILVEPAGATALAGVIADVQRGLLSKGDRVAVILSGAGYKDTDALSHLSQKTIVPTIDASDVEQILSDLVGSASRGH